MSAAWLLSLLLAPTHPAQDVPLPEGHRPFGPPLREDVLEGWETFIEDIPPAKDCANIGQPMVVALNPPQRDEAVLLLEKVVFRELSEAEAARLLGMQVSEGKPLAASVFEQFLAEMRERKRLQYEEKIGGWSLADQNQLDKQTSRFEQGDHRSYRPYLVRAVSKFGDGHGGAPYMTGDLCSDDLHLRTLTFSYTIPPSVRVPAVVFLPRPPKRVISTVMVAW